jgi:hypothetical protein
MASNTPFTTIRTEGALLPPDLLARIADNQGVEGTSPDSYHHAGERLNEVINQSWNALQGAWANFQSAREKLPDGDPATSITRERWLLPLFRELEYGRLQTTSAADFVIEGKNYPVSHKTPEGVPVHLVGCGVRLDERTAGVAGAARTSPHSLVQVLLNRSEAHIWGFVSNGFRLRLLRDNVSLTRQAYLEFDLQAMMDGEVYSDFVLLWLVCHQSRVEGGRDCWLERWVKQAQEQGTRALDQLRDGVQTAIEALGVGFLEHPANTALRDRLESGALDKQDYYRQLLRLVYRLLFLFTAEDRNLLYDPNAPESARDLYRQHYSTARLRRMAEKVKGTRHADLYEALRLVMRLLGGETPPLPPPRQQGGESTPPLLTGEAGRGLALPVLGSYLFRDEAVSDIINCQLPNARLLDAVRALAFVEDRAVRKLRPIDYRNLGPEELGSVYESLLELHPQVNIVARTFALATAGGNERKTTGSYYTPTSLINALLDSALNPVLDEAVKKGEAGILALKVCDPACGSGHFLIAAANRMAKALAVVRTGEEEPPPAAIQAAKRDIIGHCIYGVDINPMAVELCKVNLWMEALEPGKPLTFLDHRIQVGNSLLGTTPALMANGIPDDAFNPIEGDDPKVAAAMKKVNRKEREQRKAGVIQHGFWDSPAARYDYLTRAMHELDGAADDTPDAVRRKEAQYAALANDPEYVKARLLADAWCAAFVWEKKAPASPQPSAASLSQEARDFDAAGEEQADSPSPRQWERGQGGEGIFPLPMTDLLYRRMEENPLAENLQSIRQYIVELKERYQFFHWHVAFPDVFTVDSRTLLPEEGGEGVTGWIGGFDVVLGNPPWERIKIQEKEWFAERAPEIASAPNAAARRKAIAELEARDPYLLAAFRADQRQAEGESYFVRVSGRYPLCGRGDVNTYTIFAETSRQIINGYGRVGMIVPSGIATDDTTKFFFQDLMQTQSLASLYDFENREGLFPAVDSRMKFSLLTMAGLEADIPQAEFAFFLHSVEELKDDWRRFSLSARDIAALNPNTGTMATFRSVRDAEITKAIYGRVPVLMREEPLENPWGIRFATMFHMSNDSHLFRTREQLEAEGYTLAGNVFERGKECYLPLYEGKMFMPFDHRYADVVLTQNLIRAGQAEFATDADKRKSDFLVMPRSWVDTREVEQKLGSYGFKWLIGFKNVTAPTNERTFLSTILPIAAVGNSIPLLLSLERSALITVELVANLAAFSFDYAARQKMGNVNLNFYIVEQLPVIPPHTYTPALLDFIVPRVLELTYTAWDLQPFAQDVGCDGPPFIWDEERRFLLRCELDALYFHLYGINRDDADYILETFPIVKRKDEAAWGSYRTKETILAMYDQMAALPVMHVPAPKDESATYVVPDVRQWTTWLTPGPADAGVAHSNTTKET